MQSGDKDVDDQVRQHRSKAEVHTERDRLLKRADKITDVQKFLQRDSKDLARAFATTFALAIPGMIGYVVMILMWFYVYHLSLAGFAGAFSLLGLVSVACAVLSSVKALGRERPWLWWLGALNAAGTVVASVIGFFLYYRFLCYYWKYHDMQAHTSVSASQDPSTIKGGRGIMSFSKGSMLDVRRSVSFKSRWTGDVYCVAPIVDKTMRSGDDVYYWAVGKDCCTRRGEFDCDDAKAVTSRSALVFLKPEDVVTPSMRWALRSTSYSHYMDAIRLHEATFYNKVARHPTLVYWTRDPAERVDRLHDAAKDGCVLLSLLYFALSAGATFCISWKLIPRQRKEGVLRTA